ncbi:MAG: hypothetical protein JXJ04_05715 [Spirochaetales bacterium]|nr:hypothetical protein [Spirochaetales bacterium]
MEGLIKKFFVQGLLFFIIVAVGIVVSGCSADSDPTWTIMVYLDGDNNLESSGLQDLNEMEGVDLSGSGINVIVLMDRISGFATDLTGDWTGTKLFKVNYDSKGPFNATIVSTELASTELGLTISGDEELNMGDPGVCSDFIDFCKSNYPAPNYFLVFWNHGSGWMKKSTGTVEEPQKAVCFDETDEDALYTKEIGDSIEGKGITVVGFDVCNAGMLEVAYEIRNDASYMIASEESESGDGWEYNYWLNNLLGSNQSASALISAVVDGYETRYSSMTGATLSGIDLSQVDGLMSAMNSFADALYGVCGTQSERDNVRDLLLNDVEDFYNYDYDFGDFNIDIWDMADKVGSAYPSLSPAADVLKAALENTVVDEWHHPGPGLTGNPDAHGLAIHLTPLLDGSIDGGSIVLSISDEYMDGYTWDYPLAFVADSTWVPHYSGGPAGPGFLYRLWFESFSK